MSDTSTTGFIYPACFCPLPAHPTVCYWWVFKYDPIEIPGQEEFNHDSRCGMYEDFPCPSDGNKPDPLAGEDISK